jgi:hypothetical protein
MVFRIPRALTAVALIAAASVGLAQIIRLDLPQMVAQTDDAVLGTITSSKSFRTDGDKDGQVKELYFTTITIAGRSLSNEQPLTVDVTFPGGLLSPTEGAYNSEAPDAADTKVGTRVVAFYKQVSDLGNGLAANALYTSHGGLYRVYTRRGEDVVQGRGQGYAIASNWTLAALDSEITRLKNLQPGR